jgi:uncharacterized membrane protein YdjX (TVP38/TMEM64 family)
MADEATVSNGAKVRVNSPIVEGVIGNIADLGSNLVTLGELQAKLAACDLRESAARAAVPVGLTTLGALLITAALPVALIGAADLLASATGLSVGVSLLLCALASCLLGALIAFLAGRTIGRSFESFRRSNDEFSRNLAWVKTVLSQSGKSPQRTR